MANNASERPVTTSFPSPCRFCSPLARRAAIQVIVAPQGFRNRKSGALGPRSCVPRKNPTLSGRDLSLLSPSLDDLLRDRVRNQVIVVKLERERPPAGGQTA